MMDKDNERINSAFVEISKEFEYDNVSAEFQDFNDFKCTWKKTSKALHFSVSDYLINASDNVLRDFARTMLSKISDPKSEYGETLRTFLISEEFTESNRPRYLKRIETPLNGPKGDVYDLEDIYNDLIKNGYLERIDSLYLSWNSNKEKLIDISSLMRIASFSHQMDDESVPREILETAVYKAVKLISAGQRDLGRRNKIGKDWKDHPRMQNLVDWAHKHEMDIL